MTILLILQNFLKVDKLLSMNYDFREQGSYKRGKEKNKIIIPTILKYLSKWYSIIFFLYINIHISKSNKTNYFSTFYFLKPIKI